MFILYITAQNTEMDTPNEQTEMFSLAKALYMYNYIHQNIE